MHPREVAEDQEEEPHWTAATSKLAVGSNSERLRPITVTDDPPLGAEFSNPYDNTAASNVMPPH